MSINFLIVGAQFGNKGAQSMLFITVDELKKRVPGCNVYYAGEDTFDENLYAFKEMYYSDVSKMIALNPKSPYTLYRKYRRMAKDCIKYIVGRRDNLFRYNETAEQFSEINCVIDISGFNIGSKWETKYQEAYLNNIRLAKKYNIPIVLMPQSFGDFNYSKEQRYLLSEIKDLFKYPKIIFAREKDGYNALIERFHLTNVSLSTDLVLQNKRVDVNNIYVKIPEMRLPKVEQDSESGEFGAVAVIPNRQCFNHGDRESNLKLYKELIAHLIGKSKRVFLFRHSEEDYVICKMIAEQFGTGIESKTKNGGRTTYSDGKLVLLDNDFSCFEYDAFVKNFDFIICSRFHGCVHAYRKFIPCILLGWAIKYQELAENVGQGRYAFDITVKGFNLDKVISAVDSMIENRDEESKIISQHVNEIQKHNCFDQIEEWLH